MMMMTSIKLLPVSFPRQRWPQPIRMFRMMLAVMFLLLLLSSLVVVVDCDATKKTPTANDGIKNSEMTSVLESFGVVCNKHHHHLSSIVNVKSKTHGKENQNFLCKQKADNVDVDSFKVVEQIKFLHYSIFEGRSAFRNLSSASSRLRPLLEDDSLTKSSKALLLLSLLGDGHHHGGTDDSHNHNIGDLAHELLLGVTLDNLDEAEYAATHRGQTSWTQDHPFEDIDDVVHSIVHRLEGNTKGEGGHTGYDNAKYWVAGGPKMYSKLTNNVNLKYKRTLCEIAKRKTPIAVSLGVIVKQDPDNNKDKDGETEEGIRHHILAGGGKPPRPVFIPYGCWDPIRYIDLCCIYNGKVEGANLDDERNVEVVDHHQLRKELLWLHRIEILLLLLYDGRDGSHDFNIQDVVDRCCQINML